MYDGRTARHSNRRPRSAYIYMLKLHSLGRLTRSRPFDRPLLADHAAAVGRQGAIRRQRFGEMESGRWKPYGARSFCKSWLTVKSGRRGRPHEDLRVDGQRREHSWEAGTPASFDVLTNEIRGLGLNMQLEKRRVLAETNRLLGDEPVRGAFGPAAVLGRRFTPHSRYNVTGTSRCNGLSRSARKPHNGLKNELID